jgi:hypothetical protein
MDGHKIESQFRQTDLTTYLHNIIKMYCISCDDLSPFSAIVTSALMAWLFEATISLTTPQTKNRAGLVSAGRGRFSWRSPRPKGPARPPLVEVFPPGCGGEFDSRPSRVESAKASKSLN